MDAAIIESVGCPLDHDLLKLWDNFSLENTYNSDDSESTDEETKIEQDKFIQEFKYLSIDNVSDSKCSNKITEINSQNKNNSEIFFSKNNGNEERQSFSSLKDEELLNFVKEADTKSIFPKQSNKNNETNYQEKRDTKKPTVVNTENEERQFPLLSLKNNKLLNNYKSDSDTSVGYESGSDDDDEQSESVILRERYPKRHNRPENNKQLRLTPFPQNHTKPYKQHLNAEKFEAFADINPMLHNFNAFYGAYDLVNNFNSINFETNDALPSIRTFHSSSSSSESVTDEACESFISGFVTDQIINDFIPCKTTNKLNGVIPCSLVDNIFDSLVPSPNNTGNANNILSAEINNISYCNNFKEKSFSDLNDSGCIESNAERKTVLDLNVEDIPVEEVEQILRELAELKSDNSYNQNCGNLFEESPLHELSGKDVENVLNSSLKFNQNNDVCTFNGMSYPNTSQHNFDTEFDCVHSFSSKENSKETTFYSHLPEGNNILEESSKFYLSELYVNKPGNYSNLISENIASINSECLSPKTSGFMNVSEEIEHKIIKFQELELMMKGQKNSPEHSDLLPELSWDMLPFVGVDDNSVSSEYKMPYEKKASKHKHIKQTLKNELPKICWMLKTDARDKLFKSFCFEKWKHENDAIREQINIGRLGTEKRKVIHYLNKKRTTKYRGTNLHRAILSGNVEEAFCIVECHKECHETVSEINLRDSSNKTVLDYSKREGMVLLTEYLRENNATESVSV